MTDLITDHMDIWTGAQIQKTNGGRGRGKNGNGQSIYGIKKLRELILELAVRGKLLPQDPDDEPASVLLGRIAEEKKRLIQEGKIKKQKELPEIGEDEKPFELPDGWDWARLGETGIGSTGKTPSTNISKYYGGVIPFLGPGQITPEGGITNSDKTLTEEGCEHSALAQSGNILMVCIGGSIGKSAITQGLIAFNQQINCIHPLYIDSTYLNASVNTPYFQASILNNATGSATPIINRSKWEKLLVPIPPLPEQHRIVAKVDELMALCDQLEQQQTDNNATHQTLVETLLTSLTAASDPNDFDESWQRIANHFDTLFTTEQSIDHLKQTILQLAVMGRLVPQDPDDEPASVLLEKIAEEKKRLIKEGKVKKQKKLPEIGEDEKTFGLPDSWEWIRLGNALKKITDGSHHSPPNGEKGDYLYISAKNIKPEGVLLTNATYVSREIHNEIYSRCNPEYGDILYIKDGATTGIATINKIEEPFSMLSSVALLKVPEGILNTYLLLSLSSPFFYEEMRSGMTGVAITRVTLRKLDNALIPLPSTTEQHRIVTKVDELMAICDTLKARLNDAQTTQVELADAIVEQAVG